MMTTRPEIIERVYWHKFPEWYTREKKDGFEIYTIKENAPERVKKSFEEWVKHKDE